MNKSKEAEYRIGTTGTLDGTQCHKLVLEGLFGRVYRVTTTKELMDNETLSELQIKIISLKYPDYISKDIIKSKDYHHEIDYIVFETIINSLAQTLVDNDFELAPMLNQLFKSEHFFDERALGVIIKSPYDITIQFIKESTFFYNDELINSLRDFNLIDYLIDNVN